MNNYGDFTQYFYLCDAMLVWALAVTQWPSVCLSQVGVLSKQLN